MSKLKQALQEKIEQFEGYIDKPGFDSDIEQNAVHTTLRVLRYLDQIVEYEEMTEQELIGPEHSNCTRQKLQIIRWNNKTR